MTASKYPFPTVCADKQSTDWFHAISRTLKWNERERQKSFVVVEEGPAKSKSKGKRETVTPEHVNATEPVEESGEDEEEDGVSDGEGDKFDIDDSSPEAASLTAGAVPNTGTIADVAIGKEKAHELISEHQIHRAVATSVLKKDRKLGSRSLSRGSGTRSGVDSPNRFASPQPHPPHISSRHVGFIMQTPSPTDSSPESVDSSTEDGYHGARDDIHSHRPHRSGRSRIPKDRYIDLENVKTPTVSNLHGKIRAIPRGRSLEQQGHRAFAVWGQDESDSATSDSDR